MLFNFKTARNKKRRNPRHEFTAACIINVNTTTKHETHQWILVSVRFCWWLCRRFSRQSATSSTTFKLLMTWWSLLQLLNQFLLVSHSKIIFAIWPKVRFAKVCDSLCVRGYLGKHARRHNSFSYVKDILYLMGDRILKRKQRWAETNVCLEAVKKVVHTHTS